MTRRVVITGIGCVSPLGIGVASFWEALSQGHSGISQISRFDATTFDVQLAGEVKGQAAYPEQYTRWVAEDHKIAFGLCAAQEAMQDAGEKRFTAQTLLHLGTSLEAFDLGKIVYQGKANLAQVVRQALQPDARPLQMPLDTTAEIMAQMYGQPGMKLTNVSACAASTQAIGHAYRALREGDFEMALCGGFDSMINPLGVGGFQLLGALTTKNSLGAKACRPFDAARSGAVLGEGGAMLVLEPLARAQAAGKRIYAEIVGYGSSLDAYKLSAPDPGGLGAIWCMRQALTDAQLPPPAIAAISTHGTGTYLNDEVEAVAIRTVLDKHWPQVPVMATKSLIGHLIGAAGAVEVVAALQGFAQNRLHPNGSLETVGKGCELNHITGSPRPFSGQFIMKNSFGFGGQNATLILGAVGK